MTMFNLMRTATSLALALVTGVAAHADDGTAVNVANFALAESDLYMGRTVAQNGLGVLGHEREVTSVDNQPIIRMNRDTLYSSGVFDLEAGPVTIALPDNPDKRFQSMQIVTEDHYTPEVTYEGSHSYDRAGIGTRYMQVIVRTFINPDDPADLDAAHRLQDGITVEQAATGAWEIPAWDQASQDKVRGALLTLGAQGGLDGRVKMGPRGEVDPVAHLIATAQGWGLNPSQAAIYVMGLPKANDGQTVHRLTMKDVPVDAFWSISVYNADGYFQKNDLNAYSLNSITATKDGDGAAVIQFGGCDGTVVNCLPIVQGWNYALRLYRPRQEIIDGSWQPPVAAPVE